MNIELWREIAPRLSTTSLKDLRIALRTVEENDPAEFAAHPGFAQQRAIIEGELRARGED